MKFYIVINLIKWIVFLVTKHIQMILDHVFGMIYSEIFGEPLTINKYPNTKSTNECGRNADHAVKSKIPNPIVDCCPFLAKTQDCNSSNSTRDNTAKESDGQTTDVEEGDKLKKKRKLSKHKREKIHGPKHDLWYAFYKLHVGVKKIERAGDLTSKKYLEKVTQAVQKRTIFRKKFFCFKDEKLQRRLNAMSCGSFGNVKKRDLHVAMIMHNYSWPVPFPFMKYGEVSQYSAILKSKNAELNAADAMLSYWTSSDKDFVQVRLLALFAFVAIGNREIGKASTYLEKGCCLATALESCEWTAWLYLSQAFLYIYWGGLSQNDELYDNALAYLEVARNHFLADTKRGATFNIAMALIVWWMFLIKSRAVRCSWSDERCFAGECKHKRFSGLTEEDIKSADSLLKAFKMEAEQVEQFPDSMQFRAIIDQYELHKVEGVRTTMGKQSIHSTGHKISHTKPKPTRKNQENARTSDDELTQIKGERSVRRKQKGKSHKSSQASATSTQKSSPINAGDSDDYNSLTNKEECQDVSSDIQALYKQMKEDVRGKTPDIIQTCYVLSEGLVQCIIVNIDEGTEKQAKDFLARESPSVFKTGQILFVEQSTRPELCLSNADGDSDTAEENFERRSQSEPGENASQAQASSGNSSQSPGSSSNSSQLLDSAENSCWSLKSDKDPNQLLITDSNFGLHVGIAVASSTPEDAKKKKLVPGILGGWLYCKRSVAENWPGVVYGTSAEHVLTGSTENGTYHSPKSLAVYAECVHKKNSSKRQYFKVSDEMLAYRGQTVDEAQIDIGIFPQCNKDLHRLANDCFVRNNKGKYVKLKPFCGDPSKLKGKKVQKLGHGLSSSVGEIVEVDFNRNFKGSILSGYFAVASCGKETEFIIKGYSGYWVTDVITDQETVTVYGIVHGKQSDAKISVVKDGKVVQVKMNIGLCLHFRNQIAALNQHFQKDLAIYNWDSEKEIIQIRDSAEKTQESGYRTSRTDSNGDRMDAQMDDFTNVDQRIKVYDVSEQTDQEDTTDSDEDENERQESVNDKDSCQLPTDSGIEGLSEPKSENDSDVIQM